MLEVIESDGLQLAFVIRSTYSSQGINFFTPNTYSQQLGYMNRPKGYVIPPHVHNPVRREVEYTKEVLVIRSGRVRIDFYNDNQMYISSIIVSTGDIILLAYGGHGFEMLENSDIVEVKQGPYAGDNDKTRFLPVSSDLIVIKGVQ